MSAMQRAAIALSGVGSTSGPKWNNAYRVPNIPLRSLSCWWVVPLGPCRV